MTLIDDLISRGIARSKRDLSRRILGRAHNYATANRHRGLSSTDLLVLRQRLLAEGAHDLAGEIEKALLATDWRA